MQDIDCNTAPDAGDAEIVRLLREQDGRGLQLLLDQHGDRVRAGLRKIFGVALNELEIDDAVSRAGYRAWRSVASYDPSRGSLRAWLFVIARSSGLELLRSRRRERETLRPDLECPVGEVENLRESPSGYLLVVHECIAQLPRKQRAVLQADLLSGDIADATQLAESLATTKNSVYVLRSTARKALKKLLIERGCAPVTERQAES